MYSGSQNSVRYNVPSSILLSMSTIPAKILKLKTKNGMKKSFLQILTSCVVKILNNEIVKVRKSVRFKHARVLLKQRNAILRG